MTATVDTAGHVEEDVSLEQVVVGDRLSVRPGERVPTKVTTLVVAKTGALTESNTGSATSSS